MSGASSNTFRISVSARVKDASGGQAYAFALQAGHGKGILALLDDIRTKQLETSSMVLLGDFGAEFSDPGLSANITNYLDHTTTSPSYAVTALPSEGNFDVYVYAIDIFKNHTLQKHPQSPVALISDTITLALPPADMFIDGANVEEYAEHRNWNVSEPTFETNDSLFYFDAVDRNKLYVKNGELKRSEFIVDSVELVAFDSFQSDLAAVVDYVKSPVNAAQVFSVDHTQAIPTSITMPTSVTFGKEYFVYSVIHDRGLDKNYVRLVKQDYAGQPPVIESVTAKIVEL